MKCFRRISVLALCLLLALTVILPIAASAHEREQKTVRVGWYESAFHRTDRFGRKSGYGYEYQQRIAIYTGWTYEYVEGSWSELFEKLVAGEIDLLSDVSYKEDRVGKILYSAEAMGSEDYHVFIAPDNTEIRPDDFSTMNGKRVGVNKNSVQEQFFVDWAEKHDVETEIVELSVKTPEMIDMLLDGEIDMLVTLDTYGNTTDIVPVCKVGSAESYFGINKKRPDLKQDLDVAMNRLLEDNRDFNQQMTAKYNQATAVNSFLTAEEINWVDGHGTIRVGYRDNFLPFCARDPETDELTGALADYLKFAATCEKNARLSFETRPFGTTDEALQALEKGEIDCVFPLGISAYDGEQRGVIITDPLVSTEMYATVRTTDAQGIAPESGMTAALVKGNTSYESFLMDHFPAWQAAFYDDGEAAFRAVASGEADCGVVSNYRISYLGDVLVKYRLTPLTTGETMDMAFAVRRQDDCLFSILNKINHLIPTTTLNTSLTNYAFERRQVTFLEYLKENMAAVIAVAAVITALILFLLLKSTKEASKASEGQQIISETEFDRLTGLYNRDFFILYANRLYREHPETPMDAVILNIEHFHSINNLNGRDFGDEVLRALSDEIKAFLNGKRGIAARMEGDTFEIYCASQENPQALLDRFQSRLDERFPTADIRLRMGVMPWKEEMRPEQMFDCARSACNMVRGKYKTPLMVYDEEVRLHDELSQHLRNDLSRALEQHEIEVYYQPKYNIQVEPPKLASAEALVRWKHPRLGTISPDDFIPLFEQSGQISDVDNYVWNEAARQIAAWRDQYGIELPVSVNLSRVDVFEPNLVGTLDSIIEKNGLNRKDLLLEVTESAYTENAEQLIRVISELREKGYEIEMDDFGSGYSSLNSISRLPIDVLKMDMKFVQNIHAGSKEFRLVQLVLDIAKYLGVPVVAEGVETGEQVELLRGAECELVQGYYFSKPLPAQEFEKLILMELALRKEESI